MLDLLFSLLSPKSRGCDLVPILAVVAVLSVCLRRRKLAWAICVLFCLWGGVVLEHLALPMFSACRPASSRNMNSNVVRRGSRSGQSERRADVAVLGRPPAPAKGRSGLICLFTSSRLGTASPSPACCTGRGARGREGYWLQQLDPMSIYFPLYIIFPEPCKLSRLPLFSTY